MMTMKMIIIMMTMIMIIVTMKIMTMTMFRLPVAWATQPVLIASLASCPGLKLRPGPVKVDQCDRHGVDDDDVNYGDDGHEQHGHDAGLKNQFCSARRFRTRRLETAARGEVALEVRS